MRATVVRTYVTITKRRTLQALSNLRPSAGVMRRWHTSDGTCEGRAKNHCAGLMGSLSTADIFCCGGDREPD